MAINFPNNPAVNDTFTVGGTKFTFTGVKWETGAVVDLSSDTTPSLGGDLDGGANNINNVGVITATNFTGNLTGNVTGNVTGNTSGTAGGLTGDPSIQVTNATVLGNLDVQGTTTTIDTAITEVDSLNVEGSVGIGTTNPGNMLEITSNGLTKGLIITKNGNNAAFLGHNGSGDEGLLTLKDGGITKVVINGETGQHSYINSGNVGINSTIPTSQLDVNGNITSSGTVKTGTISTTTAGGAGSNLSGDGRLTLQFPSGGGGGVGMFSVYSGTSKNIEFFSGGSATFAGTVSDSLGSLRQIPFKQESSAYTLVLADSGKAIEVQGDVTVPNNVFNSGDTITIINDSSSNKTISKGTGLQYMFNTADGTNANRTLGGRGMATIYFVNGTTCYISGSQLT